MTSAILTHFIETPELACLVAEYTERDWKAQFDHVIRDISWGCLEDSELTEEERANLVPNYWIAQFDDVLGDVNELCEERVTFVDRWFKKQKGEAPLCLLPDVFDKHSFNIQLNYV